MLTHGALHKEAFVSRNDLCQAKPGEAPACRLSQAAQDFQRRRVSRMMKKATRAISTRRFRTGAAAVVIATVASVGFNTLAG